MAVKNQEEEEEAFWRWLQSVRVALCKCGLLIIAALVWKANGVNEYKDNKQIFSFLSSTQKNVNILKTISAHEKSSVS